MQETAPAAPTGIPPADRAAIGRQARDLLADLESSSLSALPLLMKGSRLARATGSVRVERWIDCETRGYELSAADADELMRFTRRWKDESARVGYLEPLPTIETRIAMVQEQLRGLRPAPMPKLPEGASARLLAAHAALAERAARQLAVDRKNLLAQLADLTAVRSSVLSLLHGFADRMCAQYPLADVAEAAGPASAPEPALHEEGWLDSVDVAPFTDEERALLEQAEFDAAVDAPDDDEAPADSPDTGIAGDGTSAESTDDVLAPEGFTRGSGEPLEVDEGVAETLVGPPDEEALSDEERALLEQAEFDAAVGAPDEDEAPADSPDTGISGDGTSAESTDDVLAPEGFTRGSGEPLEVDEGVAETLVGPPDEEALSDEERALLEQVEFDAAVDAPDEDEAPADFLGTGIAGDGTSAESTDDVLVPEGFPQGSGEPLEVDEGVAETLVGPPDEEALSDEERALLEQAEFKSETDAGAVDEVTLDSVDSGEVTGELGSEPTDDGLLPEDIFEDDSDSLDAEDYEHEATLDSQSDVTPLSDRDRAILEAAQFEPETDAAAADQDGIDENADLVALLEMADADAATFGTPDSDDADPGMDRMLDALTDTETQEVPVSEGVAVGDRVEAIERPDEDAASDDIPDAMLTNDTVLDTMAEVVDDLEALQDIVSDFPSDEGEDGEPPETLGDTLAEALDAALAEPLNDAEETEEPALADSGDSVPEDEGETGSVVDVGLDSDSVASDAPPMPAKTAPPEMDDDDPFESIIQRLMALRDSMEDASADEAVAGVTDFYALTAEFAARVAGVDPLPPDEAQTALMGAIDQRMLDDAERLLLHERVEAIFDALAMIELGGDGQQLRRVCADAVRLMNELLTQ